MALFKRGMGGFDDLVRAVQKPGAVGPRELKELLDELTTHPSATPRNLAWMMGSVNPRVREAGLAFVLANAQKDAMDLLMRAMAVSELQARAEIATQLVRMDRVELAARVNRAFQSKTVEHRQIALEIIAVDPKWLEHMSLLRAAIRSTDTPLRRGAVRVLRRAPANPAVSVILLDLLHDEDDKVRREAIRAFANHPIPQIVEPFFARLPNEAEAEQKTMIRALGELAKDPSIDIEQYLFPVLADESRESRRIAVRLIGQMPDPTAVLRSFLVHSRGLVSWLRDRAIDSILEMAKEVTAPLIELMADPDENVRVAAMMLASKLDDEAIVPRVTEILCSDEDWWIRSMAAEILARFPSDESLTILLTQFRDPAMQYSIASALAKIDRPEAAAHLVVCLQDSCRTIRDTALDGLARHATPEAIQAVGRTAHRDPDAAIRAKALEILRGFGEPTAKMVRALETENQRREAERPEEKGPVLHMVNDALNQRPTT